MGTTDSSDTDRELMSAADVGRTISRIAHEIIEKTALDGTDAPRVILLGIPTRGVDLAVRLAAKIQEFSGVAVEHGALDITLYRDDLNMKPPRPLEETTIPDSGIDGTVVVLVDDVLYSGRTVRAALDALRDIGRPRAVQLAVLRRPRPSRVSLCGPTTSARTCRPPAVDNIKVRLTEHDGHDGVHHRAHGGPVR